MMNCSGGQMPWGSLDHLRGDGQRARRRARLHGASNIPLTKPHGYVFEVPAAMRGRQSTREPITQAGRFAHEAVSFDPEGERLYLTEDNFGFPSGFYRYRPPRNPMKDAGCSTAARCRCSRSRASTTPTSRPSRSPGRRTTCEWVDIDEPDADATPTPRARPRRRPTTRRSCTSAARAGSSGAALLLAARGTGLRRGVVYFTSTQGGGAAEAATPPPVANGYGNGSGQVWAYDIERRTLDLRVPVARPARARLPGQRHHVASTGRWWSARTTSATTSSAG